MTSPTFLSRFVGARGIQAEPVATALLTHLLQHSAAAREALSDLAREIHPAGVFDGLDFSEQASLTGGEGRPDIVGVSTSGVSLLIEAKFNAGLTSAQSSQGYIGGLGTKGLLVFLVPRDRVAPIWPRILAGPIGRPSDLIPPAPDATLLTAYWLAETLPDGRAVAVTSWEVLIPRLTAALIGTDMASDMAQLTGLVEAHVSVEWVPVETDDLTERTGRQLHRLRDALRRAATSVGGGKSSLGTNDWGPARWILADDGRKLFWAGIRIPTWGRLGISPLWAVYVHHDPIQRKTAKDALAPLANDGGPGVYQLDNITIGIPLHLRLGAELDAVEQDLIVQLRTIRDLLLQKGTATEDEPSGDATVEDPSEIASGE